VSRKKEPHLKGFTSKKNKSQIRKNWEWYKWTTKWALFWWILIPIKLMEMGISLTWWGITRAFLVPATFGLILIIDVWKITNQEKPWFM